VKEEFNEDIEILKKKFNEILKMKSSISEIETNKNPQLKALPIDCIKKMTPHQGLKTR
jgi:Asp-tRNA(Asn)/Glu-tRNA(Gln) amidotransferase C subunit